jgi:hypothetical protein
MTDWKFDLDALIDETMAFAKRIQVAPPLPRTIVEPNRIPPINWNKSEREEIGERVANFRAHQLRFMKEREAYAASTLKRMWASPRSAVVDDNANRWIGAGRSGI